MEVLPANQNTQRLRADTREANGVPPLHRGAAAESEASDWSAPRGGRVRGRGSRGGVYQAGLWRAPSHSRVRKLGCVWRAVFPPASGTCPAQR